MKTILIGTRNPAKFKEIKAIIGKTPVRLIGLKDFPNLPIIEETGKSYQENALKKARLLSKLTGLPVLAEDSGLEVLVLNNKPGIDSAYYAGKDADAARNNQKLLGELAGLPLSQRKARYRCVAVFLDRERNKEFITQGTCSGRIAFVPKGRNGFGYDPIFIPRGYQKTFGQLPAKIKNQISHRARAFKKMIKYLMP